MKFYHINRDFNKTLAEQKKEIKKTFKNVSYISSDGRKIHIMAD